MNGPLIFVSVDTTPWIVNAAVVAQGIAAAFALFGGIVIARHYTKRATVSIDAEAHRIGNHIIVATRPQIKNVGVRQLDLSAKTAALVHVIPMYERCGSTVRGKPDTKRVFADSMVDGGESSRASRLFTATEGDPGLVGWRVSLVVSTPRWHLRKRYSHWTWRDATFVPKPTDSLSPSQGGLPWRILNRLTRAKKHC